MTNTNYITSISVSNVTRNKIIALANIKKTTQKELLSDLTNKEIEQLTPKDKENFIYILKAVRVKDNFKQNVKRGNNNG